MSVPTARPQPGDQLDNFQLQEVVAASARADVFRAIDVRTNQQVAIKVPHLEMEGDPSLYDRFYREEEIETKLDHPEVVKLYPNPHRSQVYIVMEWLEGRLLRQVMTEEKVLSPERAVALAIRVCEALDYVHGHGVVLRDLSPDGVMVDSEDHIKLFSFGFAGLTGARRLTFANLSASLGTPDYIAPEQVQGKHADARSDIYALGVILFQMLTGVLPFPGKNLFEVMNARLTKDAIPLSSINPALAPQLQAILSRALAREPKDRYPSAREFAHDLRHPDQLGVVRSAAPALVNQPGAAPSRRGLLIAIAAILPLLIFALLFLASRHR